MQITKGAIRNPIRMGILAEFERVFPEEKALTIEEYLKGGSRDVILNVSAFLLGFKNKDSKYNDYKELLKVFFGPENAQHSTQIALNISAIEKEGKSVGIINPYSSLTIFEYFFNRPDEDQTQTNAEFELNFFKAYLVLNSQYTSTQHKAFESTEELEKALHFPMMMFCMNYPISDKLNYDINEIWITQLFKATLFFQFLEDSEKTKPLYIEFLKHFECETWQEYLKMFMPLTMSMIKNENESHTDITVPEGENFQKVCNFIDKLSVQEGEELNEYDFLTLRSKPFYKIKGGVYRIIFNLFVVEKIFKGMYFLLRDVNDGMVKEQQVKGLKSLYGDYFSEKVLLYKTMDLIYPEKCFKLSGKDFVDLNIDGGPDYYVRKNNDVIIVESKDFLIPADAKISFDFERYQDEFEKKLYFEVVNGKEKHVGVMQLIAFIKRILSKEFDFDKGFSHYETSIYPVIVVHDHQYNVPGFNTLIRYWFEDELEILKEEGYKTRRIKPLTVINIDSLILHQVALSESIPLNKVLAEYIEHSKTLTHMKFRNEDDMKDYVMSKQVPFSSFINEFFKTKNLDKMPPLLDFVKPILFKGEVE